ncbi:MAG: hypothetical protein K2I23_05705, partial [Clostridia bacterium]|nr:hypothetical protein [Clostridia bacterium]
MNFSKKKNAQKLCLVSIIALVMMLSCIGIIFKTDKKAQAGAANATNIGSLTLQKNENQSKTFDKEIFWKLIDMLNGSTGSNRTTLKTLGATPLTSADFRASTVGGKSANSDIVVSIGGHQWIAVYLSRSKNDAPILTLWLADSSTTSTWSSGNSNYNTSWAGKYTSSLYGTSYIRAVKLNNGGEYAPTPSSMTKYDQDANSTWAIFTMDTVNETTSAGKTLNKSIKEFIEVPNNVDWQKNQFAKDEVTSMNNNCNNDGLVSAGNASTTGDYRSKLGADASYYSIWGEDALWLPSVSETGVSGVDGIWKASNSTRTNAGGTNTWLRSASNQDYCHCVYCLGSNGSSGPIHTVVCGNMAVRPAFHLNLQKVADTLNYAEPKDVETVYNGKGQNIGDISDDQLDWYDSSAMDITYDTSEMKDVGTYTAIAKLKQSVIDDEMEFAGEANENGENAYTRKFNFIIKPKPMSVSWKTESGSAWSIVDHEVPIPTFDDDEICSNDSGVKDTVKFVIKYSGTTATGATYPNAAKGEKDTDEPKNAGTYTVEITGLSNKNYTLADNATITQSFT